MIYYLGEINDQLLYLYFNMQARRNWYNILKSWREKKYYQSIIIYPANIHFRNKHSLLKGNSENPSWIDLNNSQGKFFR